MSSIFIFFKSTKQVSIYLTIFLISCSPQKKENLNEESPPKAVTFVKVSKGNLQKKITYPGNVHSRQEIRIIPRSFGTIIKMNVKEGNFVKKNDILFEISAPENQARTSRAYLDLERVKKEREFACSRYETDKGLAKSGTISSFQLDTTKLSCETAIKREKSASMGLSELYILAGKTIEKAPFDGVIIKKYYEQGENVTNQSPVLLMGSPDKEVRVSLSERDFYSGIKIGSTVDLSTDREKFSGKIIEVAVAAGGSSRMIEVKVSLEGKYIQLLHNSTVYVSYTLKEATDAYIIPRNSIFKSSGGTFIYEINSENKIFRKNVTEILVHRSKAAVNGNLSKESKIITGELSGLEEKMTVFPVEVRD